MRFCMVTTFFPPYHFGGDATYIERLVRQLALRGHDVDVIHDRDAYYLAHPGEPERPYVPPPRVTVHALKSRWGFLSPLATHQTGQPFFKPRIRELLTSGRYDVVHFHNASLIGPGAFSYGHAVKLYTTHEHWLVCPMHILWKFDREVCTKRECVRCTIHGRRPPQWWRHTRMLPRALAHIDRVISPSRFTRDKHLEQGLDVPFEVLPYFLPRQPPPAAAEDPPRPRPYFLFVGRLVRIKGLQTVLPVFRDYPDVDLVVAGEGEYEPALREMAADLPNVVFLGARPHDELRALYRYAVAVIMPSVCYEVFGIVLIEAFAEKTPVIVRNLGGMAEVIADSNGGLTFSDEPELRAAIDRLRRDRPFRETLGERGHEAYLRLWSEEPHLKRYFEIIEEAAEHRRRTGDRR